MTARADQVDPGADDLALVTRAVAGDAAAWEAIVERHWRSVWNLSRRIVRDQHGSEEVTQETFLAVHQRLKEYRAQGSLASWIGAICRHQAFDELRRRGRRARELSVEDHPTGSAPPAPAEERWVRHLDLQRAVAALPEEEREALLLSQAGYTSDELGQLLGVAPTTIRSRRARALTRLLRELDAGYGRSTR